MSRAWGKRALILAFVLGWSMPLEARAPQGRFTVSATGETVKDEVTGLVWQRAVSAGSYTWAAAESYCQSLNLGGWSTGWRPPSAKELVSIVDYRSHGPAIDTAVFPGTPSEAFWSSGNNPNIGSGRWIVEFDRGATHNNNLPVRVRCVR
ncbi:MAG: DUF1566 domain-containing protein [Deltaproteobacteria bacterium]|nr:DUF1566 domain-containing protein [Deltaproteobacteria bacterium]